MCQDIKEQLSKEEKLSLIRELTRAILNNEVRHLEVESLCNEWGPTGVKRVQFMVVPKVTNWLEEANLKMEERIKIGL